MDDDLKLRLHSSQREARAAREQARRAARELAVSRRLLSLAFGSATPERTVQRPATPVGVPQVRAAERLAGVLFVLDACRSTGTHVVVAGWAFPPVAGWNSMLSIVSVLFRHEEKLFVAATGRVARADVAAHFASQPAQAAGGARGLASAGFATEVAEDSLPRGIALEVLLRLEGGGFIFEQSTGAQVCL